MTSSEINPELKKILNISNYLKRLFCLNYQKKKSSYQRIKRWRFKFKKSIKFSYEYILSVNKIKTLLQPYCTIFDHPVENFHCQGLCLKISFMKWKIYLILDISLHLKRYIYRKNIMRHKNIWMFTKRIFFIEIFVGKRIYILWLQCHSWGTSSCNVCIERLTKD